MIRTDRDKRLALAVSLGFHILVFSALAMSGVFTFLQQKTEERPIDVTVYQQDGTDDGDVSSSAPAGASAAGSGSSSDTPTYTMPQQKALPEINEAYTNAAQEARSVAAVMAAQRTAPASSAHTSQPVTAGSHTGTTAPSGETGNDKGTSSAGQPTGAGNSTGNGNGQGNDTGNGNDTSHGTTGNGGSDSTGSSTETPGRRPAKNAHAIYKPDPGAYYPESLRRKNITAGVVVQFTVTPDGNVTDISVATSSGYPDADDAAVRLVSAYRYSPAENEYGQPVAAQGTQTVRFSLK